MNISTNARGFEVIEFVDTHDVGCSIQQSSAMGDEGGAPGSDFLWIGPNSANPKVRGSNGWIEYPVPDEVLMTTRMHVSRKQVEDLVAHLMIWLRTGSLNYD